MVLAFLCAALTISNLEPPKRPDLGLDWEVIDIRNANELKIRPTIHRADWPRWVRLYGIDVPQVNQRGYSGARQDLELLLGRNADAYYEDEKKDHPVFRNAYYVGYIWAWGKLLEFELVRDGWAKVNDEGRKGRYGKFLVDAEDEARQAPRGIWAVTRK